MNIFGLKRNIQRKRTVLRIALCIALAVMMTTGRIGVLASETEETSKETVSSQTTGTKSAALEVSSEKKTAAVKEKKGWHQDTNGQYYYIDKNGKKVKGWLTLKSKTYYLDKKGYRAVAWKKISGSWYYFNKYGVLRTGWITVKKKSYYCDPKKGGARTVGWKKIDGSKYYFSSLGVMRTGMVAIDKKFYYFKPNGKMATGWQTVNGKKYYFVRKTGERANGWQTIGEYEYYFSHGRLLKDCFTPDGWYVDAEGKKLKKSTLKEFLQIALQPAGKTVYVWGGGWDEADKGANMDSRTIGVSPRWESYFNQQTSAYNYRYTRFQVHDGLDCSGFVGWVIYNAFNTKSGNSGYVMLAENMTRTFAGKGWGSFTSAGAVSDYRAGDIMSTSDGHVYIVMGTCSDGSIVIIHSTPQGGVQISGTCTRSGSYNSEAISLAAKYMGSCYPRWTSKFSAAGKGLSYLTRYSRMRWHLSGNCMMSDPDGYADKSAALILKDLLG